MPDIKLYVADLSSSRDIKAKQNQAELILNGKKIPFDKVDISEDKELRQRMRELCDNPTALPPQVFYRDYYLGDFQALSDANEDGELMTFLRLSDPPELPISHNGETPNTDQPDSATEPASECGDVIKSAIDSTPHQNDVTNDANTEQKTFVSSTTFTLSSS